jgi:hypothetical protein
MWAATWQSLLASQSLDPVLLHLARRLGHDLVAGVELNAIARSPTRHAPSASASILADFITIVTEI